MNEEVKEGQFEQAQLGSTPLIKSLSVKSLTASLVKVQSELQPAVKDATNPHFKSNYATLQSVWDSVRALLASNGLAVSQTFNNSDASEGTTVTIVTTLLHTSGEYLSSALTLRPVKADPQGIGSAITYGRRYALASIVGVVAEEDDDGNAATHRTQERTAPRSDTRRHSNPAPRTEERGNGNGSHNADEGNGDWRNVAIHFGKNKGVRLGDLNERTRDWYADEWQPKEYNGRISPEDLGLRAALDRYLDARSANQTQGTASDEDVPY